MVKAFVGTPSNNDFYQNSVSTNYARDQTTGQLFLTSGINTKNFIEEMFKEVRVDTLERTIYGPLGAVKIFTIPAGKAWIITTATLQAIVGTSLGGAVYGYSAVSILQGDDDLPELQPLKVLLSQASYDNQIQTINPQTPIILREGSEIYMFNSNNIVSVLTMVFYEVNLSELNFRQ